MNLLLQEALSAKEIVQLLLDGKKVTLPFERMSDLNRAMSNFQVEKSRKIKIHTDLGFDIENRIIKYTPTTLPCLEDMETFPTPVNITFYCTDPTPPKRYAVFKIED